MRRKSWQVPEFSLVDRQGPWEKCLSNWIESGLPCLDAGRASPCPLPAPKHKPPCLAGKENLRMQCTQARPAPAAGASQGSAVYRSAFLSVSSSPSHPQPAAFTNHKSSSHPHFYFPSNTNSHTHNRRHALLIRHLRCRCSCCPPGSAHLPDQRWSDPGSSRYSCPRILCHSVCHRPRRDPHLQPRLVGLRPSSVSSW